MYNIKVTYDEARELKYLIEDRMRILSDPDILNEYEKLLDKIKIKKQEDGCPEA